MRSYVPHDVMMSIGGKVSDSMVLMSLIILGGGLRALHYHPKGSGFDSQGPQRLHQDHLNPTLKDSTPP